MWRASHHREGSGSHRPGRSVIGAALLAALALAVPATAWAQPEVEQAEIAVSRNGKMTYYECAIPFKTPAEIRPSEGREFCLSVLVHDPDGTGLRDWGQAAGLWPEERNRLAWSDWPGAQWPRQPPFDNRLPWGLCSSKY